MKIIKFLFAFLFILSITACSHERIENKAMPSLFSHLGSSTVALVYNDTLNDSVRVYCSAVWVDEKTILTANHCVEGIARKIAEDHGEDPDDLDGADLVGTKIHFTMMNEVSQVGEEPYTIHLGTAIKLNHDKDLALIKAEGNAIPKHNIAKLAGESPAIGEEVYAVGHQKGLYWTYLRGNVSAYRDNLPDTMIDFDGPFTQVAISSYFGSSGGGLFNSDEELVGICSFLGSSPNTVFFIHAQTINKFLND